MGRSEELFERAKRVIPGGVNSPVRAFGSVGLTPRFISRADRQKIYDADGRAYTDYVGSWGPMILGHNHPVVREAVERAVKDGLSFGAATEREVEMAELVCGAAPSVELVRMVNSGTEAVMSAVRAARGFTGRDKLVKFAGCYHGHSDAMLVKAGSGVMTAGVPDSAGVPAACAGDTLTAAYNDLESVELLFAENPGKIAAVIVEPVAANMGVVEPAGGFLKGLRRLCDENGAALIFDEVITGFRLALGGAQAYYGVTPDLSTFAKAIASGYPFGAVVGRREVMACGVPASGTFNGNPIGVAAALATIETLSQPGVYAHLEGLAQQLETGFQALARKYHRPLYLRHVGSIFILYFGFTEDVEDFRDWLTQADLASYTRFVAGCEEYGVRFTDRRGREYLSVAHTQEDIRRTLAVADQVLGEMERGER